MSGVHTRRRRGRLSVRRLVLRCRWEARAEERRKRLAASAAKSSAAPDNRRFRLHFDDAGQPVVQFFRLIDGVMVPESEASGVETASRCGKGTSAGRSS